MSISEKQDDDSDVVLTPVDIDEITDKIIDDLQNVRLDTNYKVDLCKSRIKQILQFYKKEVADAVVIKVSDKDMEEIRKKVSDTVRRSVTDLLQKTKLDTSVVQLMDQQAARDAKNEIRRSIIDENLHRLRLQAEEEARKINNCTKALTMAAKASIRNDLIINHETYHNAIEEDTTYRETKAMFDATDVLTKKLVEHTKLTVRENLNNLLTSTTGRKTDEELESEQFVTDALSQFKSKLKGDFQNQKGAVDKAVDDIKFKVGCLFCPKEDEEL